MLKDFFKDTPNHLVPPVSMRNPNDGIEFYNGDFILKNQDKSYNVNGKIVFVWFPNMAIKVDGIFTDIAIPGYNVPIKYEVVLNNLSIGVIYINIDYIEKPTFSGFGSKMILGEKNISVTEVSFAIPNMREFLGDPVKIVTDKGIQLNKSRLRLTDKLYNIEIDKLPDYKERQEKLDESGGYLITYSGKITKKNGSINLQELHEWHERFHHFLYFLNGRRVAPMFYTGSHDGENIWTDYSAYDVDLYKNVSCWSDILFLNDLPQLWKSYNKIWKDKDGQDFLMTAIHWYIEANSNAGRIEGSIILIQTALELIFNWHIIEKEKIIIGSDAEGISAANKIRLLINHFKIGSKVPAPFTALAAVPNVTDGPEVFVKIRNALVHGQGNKREELKKITTQAKFQALQLGIWYVELSLLYILDYNGKYRNRTSGQLFPKTGMPVPWMDDKSFKIGEPLEFSDDQISTFVELLEKQGKVIDPTEAKVKRCKLIGIGFSWGKPVAIGAIKQKTLSDFNPEKANLPELSEHFEWEVGYFFTQPSHENKGFTSILFDQLLKKYGDGKLMATTEIRDGNRMINSLENRGFKKYGSKWKSITSGNDLMLFLRGITTESDND